MYLGDLCRFHHLSISCCDVTISDVVQDRGIEERSFLLHNTEGLTKGVLSIVSDITTIHLDASLTDIEETEEEL